MSNVRPHKMLSRRTFTFLALAGAVVPPLSNAASSQVWDREIRLSVSQESKLTAVTVITEVASRTGFVRTPAAAGLNELRGRDVVFYSFGRNSKDMLATVTDLLNPNELVVRAYFEASLPGTVEKFIEEVLRRVVKVPGVKLIESKIRV